MDKMKKLTAIFICIFTIILIACGKKGTFVVTVNIANGKISDIQIGDNDETPDLGDVAITKLPTEMLKRQTYEVDAISGATITSNGIKDAVARCLEQASN